MDYEMFPECCGIGIIHGFYKEDRTDAEMERSLKNCIQRCINENRGRILVAITRGQEEQVGKLLRYYRFRRFDSFVNPNSGNVVRLFKLGVTKNYKFSVPKFGTGYGE